jgi:hypothetical protein
MSLDNQFLAAIARNVLEWTPYFLSNKELWLDAAAANTITLNGSSVEAWADKSANAYSLTQATPLKQPVLDATNSAHKINGKPAVVYTTASQALASTAFNIGTQAADHFTSIHVFSVGQLDLPTGSEYFLFDGANNSDEQFFGRWLQFTNQIYFQSNTRDIDEGDGAGVETNTTGILNTGTNPWMIHVENNRQGNSSFVRYNGTDVSPAGCAYGEEGFDGIVVGNNLFNGKSLYGRIGEFLIVTGILPTSDRQRIEGYLAHKWGLAGNLPSSHPYKTSAPVI